jgi:hypothetical protein
MDFILKLKEWLGNEKNENYFIYAILAFSILLPLFAPGYVLTIDMFFTPKMPILKIVDNFYLTGNFLHFLNYIVPSQIIEKVLLFLVIFVGGVGMHRLAPVKSNWARYFAGIFYILNPFVYSRFLYGHLYLLLAYALMPWFAKTVFEFFGDMNSKNAFKVGLFFVFMSFIVIHSIYFVFLFFAVCLLFYVSKNRNNKEEIFKSFRFSFLVGLIFFIFSSWWIVPSFLGESQASQFISGQIDERHPEEFKTDADPEYGVILNTAAMYGFWGDREWRYINQKEFVPYWLPVYLIILLIVVWGVVSNSRFLKNKKSLEMGESQARGRELYILPMIIVGIASLVLAVGIAYDGFRPLIGFLNNNLPFYKGYREPQKWVGLLVLVYAYLASLGADDLILRLRKLGGSVKSKLSSKFFIYAVPVFFLFIPIIYSPGLFWGFRGQLSSVDYPESWYEVNDILNSDKDDFRVLFLPWRQYIDLSFVGKIIANPAPDFFDKPVIAGDNMEMHDIYTQSVRPESKYIEGEILANRGSIKNLGEKLAPLNIKYVILVQETNFLDYDFVTEQDDLELVYYKDRIQLYRVRFK